MAAVRILSAAMRHLLVFDVDGTLTRTYDVDGRCYARALEEHVGAPIDTDWAAYRFVTDTGIAAEVFERRLGRPPSASEMSAVKGCFLALLREAEPPREVPGAAALLRHLRDRSHVLVAIATGAWRESALWKLACAGIDVAGVPVATGDDAPARDEILRIATSRAGGPFTKVTYVGDGIWDIAAAHTVGAGFVGVACERGPERLIAAGARCVLPDLRDEAALLRAAGVGEVEGAGGPG